MSKTARLENILTNLVNDADRFRESCESKVCSPDLEANLVTGLARGRTLLRNITFMVDHLEDLKKRLQESKKSV